MTTIRRLPQSRLSFFLAYTAALLLLGTAWYSANAWEEENPVVRVEEDWELVIGELGIEPVAPYVTTVMSPVAEEDQLYCLFALNPRDDDDNLLGGMRMTVQNQGTTISTLTAQSGVASIQPSETIRWTRRMEAAGGLLRFSLVSGESETWGAFSGLESAFQTNVPNLNAYSADVSVEASGVGFASYRVQSLTLKQVRRYLSNGTVLVDDSPRTVHPR